MSTLNVGTVTTTGKVNLPTYNNSNLPANEQGLLVYNSDAGTLDVNTGSAWSQALSGSDGSSAAKAADSAEALKTANPSLSGTGLYWIKINTIPTLCMCDMSLNGGGWILGMNINTSDGHNVFYGNDDFWTEPFRVSDKPGLGSTFNPATAFGNDFKAIGGGNVWKNFSGTKLMVVVHEKDGNNYYGWRSWNLTSGIATTFESFFDGGYKTASPNQISGQAPGTNGRVNYYKRITNGSIASAQSGPAGSMFSKTPNSYENADLITNAANAYQDGNRITQGTSGTAAGPNASNQSFRVNDNQGAGFGAYYDMTIDGRPESDAQCWDSGTWNAGGRGRFGRDTLENDLDGIHPSGGTRPRGGGWHYWKIWGGKPYSASPFTGGTGNGGSNYNWNGYSGYDYDFAIYIK